MSSRPDAARRSAFTLVELILAMGIGAILLLAMGSALMSTTSAADTGSDSNNSALKAATDRAGELARGQGPADQGRA